MRVFGLLSLLIVVAIIGFLGTRMYFGTGEENDKGIPGLIETRNRAVEDLAVARARELYQQKRAEGVDFSHGPCLSNNLISDWVADIAHNPRIPVDDLPENQCAAFREGKAHHFVELDPNGILIRVY